MKKFSMVLFTKTLSITKFPAAVITKTASMKKFSMVLFAAVAALGMLTSCTDDDTESSYALPVVEMVTYAQPSFPADFGGEQFLAGSDDNTALDDPMGFIADNYKDWATAAIAAGASTLGKALNAYTGTTVFDKVFGKLSVAVSEQLFGTGAGRSEELLLLDSISAQIDQLSMKLDDLSALVSDIYVKLDETELNAIYTNQQAFDKSLTQLFTLTDEAYRKLSRCESLDETAAAVREWSSKIADGTNTYSATEALAKSLLNYAFYYNGVKCNYLAAFDIYAYSQFPWESQGYGARDAYRAEVAAGMARSLNLTFSYYALGGDDYGVQRVAYLYSLLQSYFEMSKVQRHDDKAICQIGGAHLMLPARPTIYNARQGGSYGNAWYTGSEYNGNKLLRLCCENTVVGYSALLKSLGVASWSAEQAREETALARVEAADCDAFVKGQLTVDEIRAILDHYSPNHPDWNLLQCLDDGGIQGLASYIPDATRYDTHWIATDKVHYTLWLDHTVSSSYFDASSTISGYVSASASTMEFDDYLDNTLPYTGAFHFPLDSHREGNIEYYDTFYINTTIGLPGRAFLFFEPSEIERLG